MAKKKEKKKLDKESLATGESAKLSINALNFFGPPAANRNYECEIQVKQNSFNPKKYPHHNFSISNAGISFDKIVKEGKTDEAKAMADKAMSIADESQLNLHGYNLLGEKKIKEAVEIFKLNVRKKRITT